MNDAQTWTVLGTFIALLAEMAWERWRKLDKIDADLTDIKITLGRIDERLVHHTHS